DNPASIIYVKNKIKNAHKIGIDTLLVNLSTTIHTDDLISKINELNLNNEISGIIVQLPLPSSIDKNKILSAVLPAKDIDGFHPLNVGYLHSGISQGFIPCTIHNNAFIGMHTTIMDYAVIEEYAFIAAGSLIPPKKIIKSKELWIGCPAKFVRYLTGQDLEYMQDNVRNYVELSNIYNSEV
ncbi:MAG: hypothetical protein O7C58_01465, partial [Rickettsia endosymbiont of Ixodes persulcatus]|nr:hypothetical protein [Rickettsia endosymbiont of Ixodes persulcatus]